MFRIFFALFLESTLLAVSPYCSACYCYLYTSTFSFSMTSYTYPPDAKLKSRKLISEVFEKGRVEKAYPLRAHFLIHSHEALPALQVGVSVSKRYFKKAVDRNRVKRLMREAYRLHQHTLDIPEGKKIAIMLIYSSPDISSQAYILKKIARILRNIHF